MTSLLQNFLQQQGRATNREVTLWFECVAHDALGQIVGAHEVRKPFRLTLSGYHEILEPVAAQGQVTCQPRHGYVVTGMTTSTIAHPTTQVDH